MRLIDAEKLDWWYKGRPIRRVIDEAPTVDAVPVVRCCDCKYKFTANGHDKKGCPLDGVGLMNDDDFCSYGEKRADK